MPRSATPFALILIAFLLAACGSSAPTLDRADLPRDAAERDRQLRSAVETWWGTPHRYGGESHRGMDCSAFTGRILRDLYGVDLARATDGQVRQGERVRTRDLQPGDLVFFRPGRKGRHVGIYLSGGEFAHVSTSQGVTISRLDASYWERSYWTARRVLPKARLARAATPPRSTPTRAARPAPDHGVRTGW